MSVKFRFWPTRSSVPQPAPRSLDNGFFLSGTNGSTVLLIHGLTGTPHEMSFLAASLKAAGYSVLCPRLAHHGEPLAVLKKAKWQAFYGSVREAFLSLKNFPQKGPIFAGGLSMGALLALLLAEEFPEKIAGVAGLSPTLFYDGWNTPWSRHLLPLAYWTPLKHFAYFKEESPYGLKNEAVRRRVHRYYEKADIDSLEGVAEYGYPYFPVSLLHQLNLLVKYLTKKLPAITTPVQLIQAQEDDMTSVKNSEFIYARVRSRLKELILLQNSYHIITADQERETVALKMESFFSRALKASNPRSEGSLNALAV